MWHPGKYISCGLNKNQNSSSSSSSSSNSSSSTSISTSGSSISSSTSNNNSNNNNNNFKAGDKWYGHEPESLLEKEDYKILWNFSIRTDHVIEARRPDLVVLDKKEESLQFLEIVGFRRRRKIR